MLLGLTMSNIAPVPDVSVKRVQTQDDLAAFLRVSNLEFGGEQAEEPRASYRQRMRGPTFPAPLPMSTAWPSQRLAWNGAVSPVSSMAEVLIQFTGDAVSIARCGALRRPLGKVCDTSARQPAT